MQRPSPQPNVVAGDDIPPLGGRFWLLLVLTGIGTGLGAGLLMKLLRAAQHAAWSYHSGDFLHGVEATAAGRRVLVLACAGVLAGAALWLMRRAFESEGGGLSSAIWFQSGRLPATRTILSGALSIVIVGMGVSLGREAAPKEVGAAIASRLCDWAGLSRAQRRVLSACGAGAGMAAVYNVPLGGALFGLEVLLGSLELPLVLPALATSAIATAVSWLLLPPEVTYSPPAFPLSLEQLAWAAVAGPVLGLFAVLYIRLICWAGTHRPRGPAIVLLPILVFTCLGGLGVAFPQLLGNGKDLVQRAFDDQVAVGLLGAFVFLKPLATAACLRTGAPGGLFTPTMTSGAMLGGVLGHLWGRLWPGPPPGSYALLGAGALLAGATQGPISSVVLVAELTHRVEPIMVPLLLAVAGATLVTRMLEPRSIYSGRARGPETPVGG